MKFNDFFKPRWKHSDPKIRSEAIKELVPEYNLKDLLAIAIGDEAVENRKMALKKISSEEALREVAEKSIDKAVKEIAQKKLNELWTKQIRDQKSEEDVLKILEKISDPKCLEAIALGEKRRSVKEACLNRLQNPSSLNTNALNTNALFKIALKEGEKELALRAFEGVEKTVHFETLAKNAASKVVRARAKEKISGSEGETPEPISEREVLSAKFELLCRTVEASAPVGDTREWEEAEHHVRDAEETWETLAAQENPSPKIRQRFQQAVQLFWEKSKEHRDKERQREEAKQRLSQNLTRKQEICDAFDRLLAGKKSEETVAQLEDLIQQWNRIPGQFEEAKSLDHRFQVALSTYRRDFKAQAESIIQENKFRDLLAYGRELLESQNPRAIRRALGKVDAAISEGMDPESEAMQELKNLENELQRHLESVRETLKEIQVKDLETLSALAPKIEKLLDEPDLSLSEKKFRGYTHQWKTLDPRDDIHRDLAEKYEQVVQNYRAAADRYREAQEWLRWANLKKKQEICEDLKTGLENGLEPEALFAKLKEARQDWKSIGPVSWENSKEIWDTYQKLLDEIYERCQGVIADLDKERQDNLQQKIALCEKVEKLGETEQWREATEEVKASQDEWKNIGPVPRENAQEVWERFQKTCDDFFDKRREHFEEVGKDRDENLRLKLELCELAEKHQHDTQWKEATELFKKAQDDWKHIGPVPKDKVEEVWNRFRAACDVFFAAREEHFKEFAEEKAENLKKKESLCEQMEALGQLESDKARFEAIKAAQADWKTIGPVDRKQVEPLWERFRKPIDAFFEERRVKFEAEKGEREENLKKKEALCEEAEALQDSSQWKDTSEKLKALQVRWKEVGPAPRKQDRDAWQRFRSACDKFFGRMKDHYKQLDDQRVLNLRAKEDLCYQAEVLAGMETANGQADEIPTNWATVADQIRELQKKWKQTGPVHRSKSDELWHRFRMACDYSFDLARAQNNEDLQDMQANLEGRREIVENAERISVQVHTDAQIMKIKDLQRDWKNLGPVPVEEYRDLWLRFKKACDTVFAQDVRLQD